jgi:hypothetical protein
MGNILEKKGKVIVTAYNAYTVPKRVTFLRPFGGGNPIKSCGEFRSLILQISEISIEIEWGLLYPVSITIFIVSYVVI